MGSLNYFLKAAKDVARVICKIWISFGDIEKKGKKQSDKQFFFCHYGMFMFVCRFAGSARGFLNVLNTSLSLVNKLYYCRQQCDLKSCILI